MNSEKVYSRWIDSEWYVYAQDNNLIVWHIDHDSPSTEKLFSREDILEFIKNPKTLSSITGYSNNTFSNHQSYLIGLFKQWLNDNK